MKIARVFLRSSMARPAANDRRHWRDHLLAGDLADVDAHAERLKAIVDLIAASHVDVAVFPAYAVVGDSESSISRWRRLLSKAAPLTFFGALTPEEPVPAHGDLWIEETLCAVANGQDQLPEVYGPVPLFVNGAPFVAAISSSIGEVRDFPAMFAAAACQASSKRPLLIVDLGHEQYQGGRYVKLLKNVATAMVDAGAADAKLVVASWMWRESSIGMWCVDRDGSFAPACTRLEVASSAGVDLVDIIEI